MVSASRESTSFKNISPKVTSAAEPKQLEFFQCQWKVGSPEPVNAASIIGVDISLI